MQVAPQSWPLQPCLVQDPRFRPCLQRSGWLLRARAHAGRDMDMCLDIPIMAKARQESSDPTSSKKKAGDRWKWPDWAACALRVSRRECTMSDHAVYFFYFIISHYIITILLVITEVPGPELSLHPFTPQRSRDQLWAMLSHQLRAWLWITAFSRSSPRAHLSASLMGTCLARSLNQVC